MEYTELRVAFLHHNYQHKGHDPKTENLCNGAFVIYLPKEAMPLDLIQGWQHDWMLLQVLGSVVARDEESCAKRPLAILS